MPNEHTQEKLWKLYEGLPGGLKELIFSEKAANIIWNICQENKIPDDDVSKVSGNAGKVILGVLPLDKFRETIQTELKIKESLAKKISDEVNELIFSPVESDLARLYGGNKKPPLEIH